MEITKIEIDALKGSFKSWDYDSLENGEYLETEHGQYFLVSKPSIRHRIDSRCWIFSKTADADGEPIMDDIFVSVI